MDGELFDELFEDYDEERIPSLDELYAPDKDKPTAAQPPSHPQDDFLGDTEEDDEDGPLLDPISALSQLENTPDEDEEEAHYDDEDELEEDEGSIGDPLATMSSIIDAMEEGQEYEEGEEEYDEEEDELGGYDLDRILTKAIDLDASDVHINSGKPIAFTILGDIVKQPQLGQIPDMILSRMYAKIVSHVNQSIFAENFDLDTSYTLRTGKHKGRRTRLSVGRSLSEIFMVFRIIPNEIASPDKLGVSPKLQRWVRQGKGMVLVCGETGSGKALHKNTLIPTPKGYVRAGAVKVGASILDAHGRPTKVVDIHGVSEDEEMFKFMFSNGERMRTSGGHLWRVRVWDANDRGQETVYTEHVYTSKDLYELMRENYADMAAPIKKISVKKVDGPMAFKPVKSQQVSPHIFATLLGVKITEDEIVYGSKDELQRLKETIDQVLDTQISQQAARGETYSMWVSGELAKKVLPQRDGKLYIPPEYLFADTRQRQELLSTLMRFFAQPLEGGSFLFAIPSTHTQIVSDIYKLASGLGYSTSEIIYVLTDHQVPGMSKWTVFRCADADSCNRLTLEGLSKTVSASSVIKGQFTQVAGVVRDGEEFARFYSRHDNMLPVWADDVFIVDIEPVQDPEYTDYKDYICFEVDHEEHLYLCGSSGIPTHNSTTFASVINELTQKEPLKIITIEKPVEFVYDDTNAKATITQREVGPDTRSFASGLKAALRQAPNVIMVGEVRDYEEFNELLTASESGHLALSTLHATSPDVVIDRICGMYSGQERARVLSTLKSTLSGVVNQVLVKSVDGTRRYAIQCVLEVNKPVQQMIANADSGAILTYMQENEITMEHELIRAVEEGKCKLETARYKAPHPLYFDELAKAKGLA